MLGRAMMIGYRSGFNTDEDLMLAFDIVTAGGAKALRLEDHGLRVGAKADFVAIDAPHVPQAVVDLPRRRAVYKNGRLLRGTARLSPEKLESSAGRVTTAPNKAGMPRVLETTNA
jgi:cytosine/adenosine deaminase-related metal-dependent hydrolase